MSEQQHTTSSSINGAVPWWIGLCRWLWKFSAFLGIVVIVGVAINVVSTWLTSSKGTIPSDSPFDMLLVHWPIVLLIGLCLLLIALLTGILSRWPLLHPSLTQQNRTRMLELLQSTYDAMHAETLEKNIWTGLTLSEKPDAVENAATFLLRVRNQPARPLPVGTSILDIYDQAAGDLLILGEPGTGKSTLLLELAQQLVKRAVSDAEHPLPVILPLSSWAAKRSSLQDWMIDKLVEIYQIPRQVGEQWVEEGVILPLLDGFDEMNEAARPTQIVEINRYHQAHKRTPLVVCSRTAAYDAVAKHKQLILQRAVIVQPFTNQQVNAYLLQAGKDVAALRSAIKKNLALQELATTPLMLSVLIRTYQGTTVRELPSKQSLLLQEVWSDYITQMVQRKGNKTRYPLEQTRRWLIYLAQQLRAQKQSIFSVEQLQPDWLPKQRRTLYQWCVGLIIGVSAGLVSGLGLGLSFRLVFGLVGGLIFGLVTLVFGLSLGLIFGSNTEITPIEVLTWRWKDLRAGLILGLSPIWLTGLAVELGLVNVYLAKLGDSLIILLAIALASMLSRGFSGTQLADRRELSPNEGIRRSFKHGLLILVARLGIGLLFGLGFGLALGPDFGLIAGLGFGLGFGLIYGLLAGLGAALQHYILRFWLWRTHTFPLRVVSFLDEATICFLLKRNVGGYSFSHQLLQDYLADLPFMQASITSTTLPPTGTPSS